MATNLLTENALTKGGNIELPDGIKLLEIALNWETPELKDADSGELLLDDDGEPQSIDLDVWAFMLGANGKVLTDEHFIFFNNLVSPCKTVTLSGDSLKGGSDDADDEVLSILLSKVSDAVHRIVILVNIYDGRKRKHNFGLLDNASISLSIPDGKGGFIELTRYDIREEDVSDETSLMFGELYRSKGKWKFRAIAQGQASGPANIAREFGVDVGDDPEPEEETVAAAVFAPPALVVPKKHNLAKGNTKLDKPGAMAVMAITPEMEFSLYWTNGNKDYGLILLVTYADGTEDSIDWRKLRDNYGEIIHDGDRLRGGRNVREYATFRFMPGTKIRAVAVVGYSEVSNGPGSFRGAGAHAVVDDGNGNKVDIDLKKGGVFSYHAVLTTILVDPDTWTLKIDRPSRFSAAFSERRPRINGKGVLTMQGGPVVIKP